MRFAALAALALIPAAQAAITILGPSPSEYWVQYTTNTITWTYASGDPNPINIDVFNTHNTTLNGNFSIASYVNVSQQSFTVTNVTLVTGGDYAIRFISPTNSSMVYATSQLFSVMAPGTAPAPTTSASSSASSTASGSSSSSTSTTSAGSGQKSSAIRAVGLESAQTAFGIIAACGVASLSALLL
ncbi:uncharacterized protein FIBRA_06270 [Fibroporia radiculosa]|uniref:Yeast cell wall synthesis Kre9/Knh1-like N-terminal domain-containing protein n=1 Tax=Fibroporia radiculosa TaxID=599839 RepID=J4GSG0_9APHY|nr:uncharacterized protein FIBRA_06270 [Fibroporia radiculosa]CCM04110.1 predicted protein [Fibroporia radiculosa]